MHDAIENLLGSVGSEYQEIVIRSHLLSRNSVSCRDGEIEETTAENLAGFGIRVLFDGSWGFASFSGSRESINDLPLLLKTALLDATKISKTLSSGRGVEVELAPINPTKGKFEVFSKSKGDLSLEEMLKITLDIDKEVRTSSAMIKSSGVVLGTIRENRSIFTLSGTNVEVQDMKSDLYVSAIAAQNSRLETHTESLGVTGSIRDIFQSSAPLEFATRASNIAVRKLDARIPQAGMQIVVLDPEIVGLLCHEAIGHTVEADFVLSGSITRDKIGENVASSEVTMIDSGINMDGAGWVPVDDEGTQASDTVLIEEGTLHSYLHNRETAAIMNSKPTGNGRAGGYSREPIIRMTNTFIAPGKWKREEIIEDTKDGILLSGAGSGEADANAEFVFDVAEAYPIRNGEVIEELLRGTAISGNAFETLKSVDAIGKNFKLRMGAGACLKGGQPVKVDGGGPSLRCNVRVAGRNQDMAG